MKRWHYLVPLVLFVVVGVFLAVGLTRDPERVPSPLVGKPVPAFNLPRLAPEAGSIGPQQLRGEVYLLNVWATWCGGCRAEHPVLMEAARREGIRVLGLDYKDERAAARRWLQQRGDPYFASAFDGDGRVGIDLGVYGVPETYVIDARGIIRFKHTGALTRADLNDTIEPLVRRLQEQAS
jgi:cytochrome c biogenesis protein CcmG/thiol:disulfide interchange protein DsbE